MKSLGTRDINEANSRKHQYIAEYKRQIKALQQARHDPLREVRLRALEWRDAIEKAKGETVHLGDEDYEENYDSFLMSEALDEARDVLRAKGEKEAKLFLRIIKSTTPPLKDHYERWLDQEAGHITKQTARQHRQVIQEFLAWAGEDICIGEVNRKRAGEYVDELLSPRSGLSRKTVARYLSSLSSLWRWFEDRGLTAPDSNPWLRQLRGKRAKRSRESTRRQWEDKDLVKLLTGDLTLRYTETLHDLVRLALVTGARLDELCSLKVSDAEKRADGWWIVIREGKTEAAVREVPVHEFAAHVLERRRRTSNDYLFSGLVPGGPDKKRSWNVSKAFGRYCTKLGFDNEGLVFHSLRKTFIEAMEAAVVPEPTVKLLVGHKRQSITFGGYSKGERVETRKAINRLQFSLT